MYPKFAKIANKEGFKKIAVISGIGVREYYKKLGYKNEKTYMTKNIEAIANMPNIATIIILVFLVMSLGF